MGKIIFWLVVAFVVLLVVRLINARHALRMRTSEKPREAASELVVRCVNCGVFIPRAEALAATDGFRCATGTCKHA